jgi:hypothetical protein
MASFVNKPLLDVDLDIGGKRATVVVSGRVSFSPLERQLMQSGLAMTIRGKLMGADSGFLGDDDFILSLGQQTFTNNQPIEVDYRLVKSNVSGSTLKEDSPGADELRADLTIFNSLNPDSAVAKASSNEVTGSF